MLAGLRSRPGSSSRRGPRASRSRRSGSRARCPRAGGRRASAGAWPARRRGPRRGGGACTRARGRAPSSSSRKPSSNSGLAAAGLGEDEAPLLDVVAEVLPAPAAVELGGLVAVEEDDRGLEQVLDGGDGRGRRPARSAGVFQSRETTPTRLRTSSGSLFQSPRGPWRSLLIRTGARPLARNSSAKLVATTGSLLDQRAPARSRESWSCSWTSSSAPSRYQSCSPKKRRPPSRPARSRP